MNLISVTQLTFVGTDYQLENDSFKLEVASSYISIDRSSLPETNRAQ